MDRRGPWPTALEAALLLGCAALLLLPAFLLRGWWVEDAAIAFGYARNLANGDGLVPFVGGERAEGYSDPLWVLILAAGQRCGLDPFLGSKLLGTAFAAACVPLTWRITRQLSPGGSSAAGPVALFAALLVGTHPLLGIWANAGLENALFSFLLAAGTTRLLGELGRTGGFPWSYLIFLGLALTRTEGIAYGVCAVAVAVVRDLAHRRGSIATARLVALLGPYLAYQAARYAWFALPFSLPYYAKLADNPFRVTDLGNRGWTAFGRWALATGAGVLAPVSVLGLTRGRWVGWIEHPGRVLLAAFGAITLGFAVLSNGDWMSGYRFYAQAAVPGCVAYALGRAHIVARLPRARQRVGGALLALIPVVWNLAFMVSYARKPESMTPFTTRGRVASFNEVADRIHLDRPWVAVDHAMGGHLWFAPPRGRTIDWYGLTDVTFALHRPVHGFAGDYLLKPATFDFAHMEAGFRRQKEFLAQFVQIPKSRGRTQDDWVRRGLLTLPAWPDDATAVAYPQGQRLEGVHIPTTALHPGGALFVEVGVSRAETSSPELGLSVRLVGPVTLSFAPSLGYDGILPPAAWFPREVFVGRYALPLPADLPLGDYTVEVQLTDGQAEPLDPGLTPRALAVVVGSAADARAAAEGTWTRALAAATAGACDEADGLWADALHADPEDQGWAAVLRQRAEAPLAGCWADRAADEDTPAATVEDLRRARRWDPRSPAANRVGAAFADRLWPEAEAARASGGLEQQLALFEAIVLADPTRAWARRYAEDARGELLARRPAPRRRPR